VQDSRRKVACQSDICTDPELTSMKLIGHIG
jgi:hypothetical protein